MVWTETHVHVIDFEGSVATGIVEFGVVTLHRGEVVEVATRLCRPKGRVGADETRVHGLRDADLEGSEGFEAEWPRFARLRETGVLAAHFSATENALLRAVWPCPRLSPDFIGRDAGGEEAHVAAWGPWIDTGRIAIERVSGAVSAGLSDVVAALGLQPRVDELAARWCPDSRRRYHCALYDALACAAVLPALARESDGTPWSLVRLAAASTGNRDRRDDITQGRLF